MQSLDKVSPNNPVILTHASGHASFANAKALELSNVTKDTANPERRRNSEGQGGQSHGPAARNRVAPDSPRRGRAHADAGGSRDARDEACSSWPTRKSISKGITSFQDAGSSFEVVNRMKRMIDAGRMNVRLWVMVREYDPKQLAANRVIGYGNNQLTVRAIKITGDGALGSRGAWLLEPYCRTRPDSVGLADDARGRRCGSARRSALDAGYQVCIHAIGDRANREVAQHLRRHVQEEQQERQGPALARGARAAHQRRRTFRASASSA